MTRRMKKSDKGSSNSGRTGPGGKQKPFLKRPGGKPLPKGVTADFLVADLLEKKRLPAGEIYVACIIPPRDALPDPHRLYHFFTVMAGHLAGWDNAVSFEITGYRQETFFLLRCAKQQRLKEALSRLSTYYPGLEYRLLTGSSAGTESSSNKVMSDPLFLIDRDRRWLAGCRYLVPAYGPLLPFAVFPENSQFRNAAPLRDLTGHSSHTRINEITASQLLLFGAADREWVNYQIGKAELKAQRNSSNFPGVAPYFQNGTNGKATPARYGRNYYASQPGGSPSMGTVLLLTGSIIAAVALFSIYNQFKTGQLAGGLAGCAFLLLILITATVGWWIWNSGRDKLNRPAETLARLQHNCLLGKIRLVAAVEFELYLEETCREAGERAGELYSYRLRRAKAGVLPEEKGFSYADFILWNRVVSESVRRAENRLDYLIDYLARCYSVFNYSKGNSFVKVEPVGEISDYSILAPAGWPSSAPVRSGWLGQRWPFNTSIFYRLVRYFTPSLPGGMDLYTAWEMSAFFHLPGGSEIYDRVERSSQSPFVGDPATAADITRRHYSADGADEELELEREEFYGF
ncbi:MAG TPA: hypothetical protein VH186_36045 [Chloroflexia bacterium]|nr:hypothetical protein [Chloroflexia bacterium]